MARSTERHAQKSRTREALLAGAHALLTQGQPVTVAAAAAQAGISKATAYRYFSDASVLAAEAGLHVEVASYDRIVAGTRTPRDRLVAISVYMIDLALDHQGAFRQFMARSLDASISEAYAAWRSFGAPSTKSPRPQTRQPPTASFTPSARLPGPRR